MFFVDIFRRAAGRHIGVRAQYTVEWRADARMLSGPPLPANAEFGPLTRRLATGKMQIVHGIPPEMC